MKKKNYKIASAIVILGILDGLCIFIQGDFNIDAYSFSIFNIVFGLIVLRKLPHDFKE